MLNESLSSALRTLTLGVVSLLVCLVARVCAPPAFLCLFPWLLVVVALWVCVDFFGCMQSTVDKLIKKTNLALVVGSSSWREQFVNAVTVSAGNAPTRNFIVCLFVFTAITKPPQQQRQQESVLIKGPVQLNGGAVLHVLSSTRLTKILRTTCNADYFCMSFIIS